ncbi:MAG TPA: YgcG family protein [Methylophilus sp.]|nr:YgcG family protein [Methylophilus sp.]HQQ32695.1 YgcG family protein [Methylophilus sp.]
MSYLKAGFLALCLTMLLASRMTFALVEVPELRARVTDLTGTLTAPQQASLEAKLKVLEDKKGSQVAILILPSTQPEDIAQYSIRAVEKWQLGREKPDDGVLLLVAKNDRKLRIEVGRGLEGAIPDIYAKRIISDVISPRFKGGDFFSGLDAGIDSLSKLIEGEALPIPEPQKENISIDQLLPMLLFGGLVSGLVLRGMFGTFVGSALNGGLVGIIVYWLGTALFGASIIGFIAFFITMMLGSRGINGYSGYPGSYGGGPGSGGWSGSGDVFSGGGGDFGGGGASGDW